MAYATVRVRGETVVARVTDLGLARRVNSPNPIAELKTTNYKMIEPRVRPAVRILVEAGFLTFMSCHGHRDPLLNDRGEAHCDCNGQIRIRKPWIVLDEGENGALAAAALLLQKGCGPLSVKRVTAGCSGRKRNGELWIIVFASRSAALPAADRRAKHAES